jgi:hypothetical protein
MFNTYHAWNLLPSGSANCRWLPPEGADKDPAVHSSLWDHATEGEYGFVSQLKPRINLGIVSFTKPFSKTPVYASLHVKNRPELLLQAGDAATAYYEICSSEDRPEHIAECAGEFLAHLKNSRIGILDLISWRAYQHCDAQATVRETFRSTLETLVKRLADARQPA